MSADINTTTPETGFVIPANAGRNHAYEALLARLSTQDICPFDASNYLEWTRPENILYDESDGWVAINPAAPYTLADRHILLFPREHVVSPAELSRSDWGDFGHTLSVVGSKLGIPTGGVALRYSFEGAHQQNGSTIRHIHAHVLRQQIGRVLPFEIG